MANCTACGRDRFNGCRCVPAEFWDHDEVEPAFHDQDLVRVVQLLRSHTGLTQEALANLTGLSQGTVSRLESGRVLRDIDKTRRALQALRDLAPASPDRSATAAPAVRGKPPAAWDPTAAETSADFVAGLCDIDDVTVDLLTDDLRRLSTAYVHQPIEPLVAQLIAVRDSATRAYRAGTRPRHAHQLLLLVATASLLLAHAAQNLGDRRGAATHLSAAHRCAKYAEHDQLRSWALATAALFAEWIPRPTDAADRAARAFALAPVGHSGVRAAAIEARAAARAGDHRRAQEAMQRAERAGDATTVDDDLGMTMGGLFTFPDAKLRVYRSSAHLFLGGREAAIADADAALGLYEAGPVHDYSYGDAALARVTLASAHVGRGDLDAADAALEPLLELPEQQRIQQLGSALAPLRKRLQQPPLRDDPRAREMGDRLNSYQVLDATRSGQLAPA